MAPYFREIVALSDEFEPDDYEMYRCNYLEESGERTYGPRGDAYFRVFWRDPNTSKELFYIHLDYDERQYEPYLKEHSKLSYSELYYLEKQSVHEYVYVLNDRWHCKIVFEKPGVFSEARREMILRFEEVLQKLRDAVQSSDIDMS